MLALGRGLLARGHDVTFETWEAWREPVQQAGMTFLPAPEHPVFPGHGQALKPYAAVVRSVAVTRPRISSARPDAVVADILTLAPSLAAELEGVPTATLVPHVHPVAGPGFPPYSMGARLPRTAAGRHLWQALQRPVQAGLRVGRAELNETRRRLGLEPRPDLHTGLSHRLCMVATFPQLEYPRAWPDSTHVIGPLLWEPPAAEVQPPPGARPLVLVAPSTSQDPGHRLLRAALAGLEGEPVRVLATWNRRPLPAPTRVPANARLVEWVSYARTMPRCALVICHGGHGTVARALASGSAVLACPAAGDMAENAARIDWAGVGVRLPWRLLSAATLRLAVRRALGEPQIAARAQVLAAWTATHDAARRGAELVEELAGTRA